MLKFSLIFLLVFLGAIFLYLGLAFLLSRITVPNEVGAAEEVTIYIKTNGVHTDIVVPVKTPQVDWSERIKFSDTLAGDTTMQYLGIGWGDKGFYLETPTWSDLQVSVALRAAFARGTTAIHTTFYGRLTEGETCRKIMISEAQYARLVAYITNSFQQRTDGDFINIITTANYGDNDAFYEANGHYSLLHTCNTWANNALKSCGQKACLWAIFDTGIFLKYE